VWDRQNVLQELDGTDSLIAHYTDFPGRWGGLSSVRLAQGSPLPGSQFNAVSFGGGRFNQAGSSSGGSRFYLFDQQASTRYLLTTIGSVSDRYLYRGFGEEVFSSGITRNPLRFQGQVGIREESNDTNWMRTRIYDPVTGQFLSNDPIGFMGGDYDLRRFVKNNPIKRTDPSGL
jgi:RHS repeat-associated protein